MTLSDEHLTDRLCSFLGEIGVPFADTDLPADTFLPGLLIDKGALLIDRYKLLYPGDILHEAGHIAVTSSDERPLLNGNITEAKPEKGGDEIAVLLWTYAACVHLKIDPAVVFHPAGYNGQSEWLIEQFTSGQYIGMPLLVWMGLAESDTFPTMRQWLRA